MRLPRSDYMRRVDWVIRLGKGFQPTVFLRQSGISPLDFGPPATFAIPDTLFATNTARFRPRAHRAVPKYAQQIWSASTIQVDDGWLLSPEPLCAEWDFRQNSGGVCNRPFLLGAPQSGKRRLRGDFRGPLANTACMVRTPITLPGRDRIASALRLRDPSKRSWLFCKVDPRAACQSIPLSPSGIPFAVIALWRLSAKLWYGFRHINQLSAPSSAALR